MDVCEAVSIQDAGMILVPLYEEELNYLATLLRFDIFFMNDEKDKKVATNLLETLKNYGASEGK